MPKQILFLIVACWWSLTRVVLAATPIIPVEEIRAGMQGYAKTVIYGDTIETFPVEVLGVTGNQDMGYQILIKASGSVIERSGGISQGMSGSPVYIDGRLAGAVAFGKAFTDSRYCFLQPIGNMLKLLDKPVAHYSGLLPKSTPLMAGGFTGQGLAYLEQQLTPFDLTALDVGGAGTNTTIRPLEPGSSVGVAVVDGDMTVGALGTVTWMDDDGRILAFGHPFLQRGNADYFMTNAWIFASIPNVESSYKVGALGNTVGAITQDRAVGVAGKINQYPHIIPMFVSVTDMDRGINKSATVQMVTDEALVPLMLDAVCFNTVSATTDRNGGGTARVSFRISARGENSGEITIARENMFYNPSNLAKAINGELVYIGDLLMNNKFEKVTLFDVNVNIEATSRCDVAEITRVNVLNGQVKAGENVTVEVEFQPYRSAKFTKKFDFKVPANRKAGSMPLIVRGGGASAWLATVLQKQQSGDAVPKLDDKKTLNDFLHDFNDYDKNNEIVIDVMPNTAVAAQANSPDKPAEDQAAMTVKSLFKGSNAKQKYPVDFIIDGETQISVQVVQ